MYDYIEAMKEDVKQAIEENYTLSDYFNRENLETVLNDDLWINDSVTGNGSGSYTFNSGKAKEYVSDNLDLLKDMCNEFEIDGATIGEKFINEEWEWMDVSIRCYLLSQAVVEVLDEMEENGELNFNNETTEE